MNRQDAKNLVEPSAECDRLASMVVDAAIEVHRHLGPGFLESVYEEALSVELKAQKISFEKQFPVSVRYKDQPVGEARLDFLVGGQLVVELKAVETLAPIHIAQVISYLKALDAPLGLLFNFNVPLLKDGIKRVVLSSGKQDSKSWRLGG